ncbi:MAG: hypothetical protein U0527_13440 [Candidatus Eisenbacteria bacterium]
MFGGERFVTVVNMSEFQESHMTSRLIGAPAFMRLRRRWRLDRGGAPASLLRLCCSTRWRRRTPTCSTSSTRFSTRNARRRRGRRRSTSRTPWSS